MIRTILLFTLLAACAGAFGRPGQAAEPPFELGLVAQDGRISAELPSATDITLRLRGVWRDACLPRLVGFSGSGHRRLLTLEVPEPGQVCAQVLTPFEFDIPGVRFEVEEAGLIEVALVERDCKENQLFRTDDAPEPTFTKVLQLDLASVVPSLARRAWKRRIARSRPSPPTIHVAISTRSPRRAARR